MPSLKDVADRAAKETRLPSGYAETMDKLKDADKWDVPGVIADAGERLREATDEGPALAVMDTLLFRLRSLVDAIDKVTDYDDETRVGRELSEARKLIGQ